MVFVAVQPAEVRQLLISRLKVRFPPRSPFSIASTGVEPDSRDNKTIGEALGVALELRLRGLVLQSFLINGTFIAVRPTSVAASIGFLRLRRTILRRC